MKRLIRIITLAVMCVTTFSQNQPTQRFTDQEIADMSISDFQAYQKTLQLEVKSREAKSASFPEPGKLEQYANVGKILGQAFKDCWSTVSTDAEKFAQSPAGKWTAFLITWKIMGKDAVDLTKMATRWMVGIGLFTVITPCLLVLMWRNCATRRIIKKEERTSIFNYKREYGEVEGVHEDVTYAYWIAIAIFSILVSLIMFA
jgi:hypothetical protein